jgi:aspartate ammonia-lyase
MNNSDPKYIGDQTKLALDNFPFNQNQVHIELIYSITQIKKAACIANYKTQNIDKATKEGILRACDEILEGNHDNEFVLPAIQGGAGTSINMNVNEVIANRASEIINVPINPNDDVNKSQSTNDVNPSALKILVLDLMPELISSLESLKQSFLMQAEKYKNVKKLARTHLQDAVPTTIGAEFNAYAAILNSHIDKIKGSINIMYQLNLGGTAIGNKINASDEYIKQIYKSLKDISGKPFEPAENMMSETSSQSGFVNIASTIKILFTDLSKISTDLRILASGPKGGIGEIKLEERQKGSSIMPGKVNPVIPETINQVYYYIYGKTETMYKAMENSSLELGIMFPVLADSLINIIKIGKESINIFDQKCIQTLKVDEKRCKENLEKSTAYATLLSPRLGYDKVSKLVKEAISNNSTIRNVVVEKYKLISKDEFNQIVNSYIEDK